MTSSSIRARLAAFSLVGLVLGPAAPASAACGPSPLPADAPIALVLSGGGAKGAYEAGGGAAGRLDRLEALGRGLTRDRVYSLRTRVFFAGLLPGWLTLLTLDRAGSLFDPEPLRALISAS